MKCAYSPGESVQGVVDSLLIEFNAKHHFTDRCYLQMMEHASLFHCDAGVTLMREGDQLNHFLLLLRGTVRYQKRSSNGRQLTIFRVQGGESCALAAACLFSQVPLPAEAVTESEVYGYTIRKDEFIRGLQGSQEFRKYVFGGYGNQLGGVLNLATEVAFDSISVRLMKYLLSNADAENTVYHGHQEIAEDLGTVREVISREIKVLKDRGWIDVGRGRIRLKKKEDLQDLVALKGY